MIVVNQLNGDDMDSRVDISKCPGSVFSMDPDTFTWNRRHTGEGIRECIQEIMDMAFSHNC
jgi:hypothetical protein